MKKRLKRIILILLLIALSYLGYCVISKIYYKTEIESLLQTIPEFHFTTLEGKEFNNSNLKQNTPIVFIYFTTECGYCHYEAQDFSNNIKQFKDVQLIFVSTETKEAITHFAKTYQLYNMPNITFLHDTTYNFSNRFDATCIPYVLVYNSNQQLIRRYKGQLTSESIRKLIKDNKSSSI